MGVKGLWSILKAAGRRAAPESLSRMRVAIDASIWLHSFLEVSIAQNRIDANANVKPHLIGMFNRICKLLFYNARPIFVFDGGVPYLKRDTIIERKKIDEKREEKRISVIAQKLLDRQMKSKKSKKNTRNEDNADDSALKEHSIVEEKSISSESDWDEKESIGDGVGSDAMAQYHAGMERIPGMVNNSSFSNQPLAVQYDLLEKLYELRSTQSRSKLHSLERSGLSVDPASFSSTQFSGFLEQSRVSRQLEEIRMKMRQNIGEDGAIVGSLVSDPTKEYFLMNTSSTNNLNDTHTHNTTITNTNTNSDDFWNFNEMPSNPEDMWESNSSSNSSLHKDIIMTNISGVPFGRETKLHGEVIVEGEEVKGAEIEEKKREKEEEKKREEEEEEKREEEEEEKREEEEEKKREEEEEKKREEEEEKKREEEEEEKREEEEERKREEEEEERKREEEEEGVKVNRIDSVVEEVERKEEKGEVRDNRKVGGGMSGGGGDSSGMADVQSESDNNTKPPLDPNLSFFDPDSLPNFDEEDGPMIPPQGSITKEMVNECKHLLNAFGIPYISSPMEAEAQCVYLEREGIVDGVVSDDSDSFLFGAKRVYRHMFKKNMDLELYDSMLIHQELGLSRERLIVLALLLGSDYTSGVFGVGPMNAMDIVNEFCREEGGEEEGGEEEGGEENSKMRAILNQLHNFSQWVDSGVGAHKDFSSQCKILLKTAVKPTKFPNEEVVKAYLCPAVSGGDFGNLKWRKPDLEGLRQFCRSKLGWNREHTDSLVLPIIKEMGRKEERGDHLQTKIDFFALPHKDRKESLSNRMRNTIARLTSKKPKRKLPLLPNPKLQIPGRKKKKQKGK